jgi:hypothetical protein
MNGKKGGGSRIRKIINRASSWAAVGANDK